MSHLCPYCHCAIVFMPEKNDPGVDWVGRVLHERLLADRDTRWLREHGSVTRARVTLKDARSRHQARTRRNSTTF